MSEHTRLKELMDLEENRAKIELLEAFCLWLEEHGYTDTDWREEPHAIDEFLKTQK